jgi:hypothetical protein
MPTSVGPVATLSGTGQTEEIQSLLGAQEVQMGPLLISRLRETLPRWVSNLSFLRWIAEARTSPGTPVSQTSFLWSPVSVCQCRAFLLASALTISVGPTCLLLFLSASTTSQGGIAWNGFYGGLGPSPHPIPSPLVLTLIESIQV